MHNAGSLMAAGTRPCFRATLVPSNLGPKSAAYDFGLCRFACHRTQRGPSTVTDVCYFSEPTYLQSFSKKHSTFRLHYSYKRHKSARWHGKRAERSCLPWFFFVTFFVSRLRKSIAVVLNANLLYWWFWKWSKPYNQLVTAYIGNLRPLRLSLQKK